MIWGVGENEVTCQTGGGIFIKTILAPVTVQPKISFLNTTKVYFLLM